MARPRGFIDEWSPKPETVQLVGNVQGILGEYRDILPLTLRQIFYLLVTGYGYDKTEKAYKRLCETMNKSRRARLIDMNHIRDDGLRKEEPHSFHSEPNFFASCRHWGSQFRLPRQRGQEQHLFVWCEAGGMLPQLAKYCDEYGVTVLSSGGFDSVTTKHNFAKEAAELGWVQILHIGDHDPSGVHMCSSLDEDLQAFVGYYGGEVEVIRLAVVEHQIEALGLPTAPPKTTDRRSFHGLTTQAEAIRPEILRDIVQDAISSRMDMGIYYDLLDLEEKIRDSINQKFESL